MSFSVPGIGTEGVCSKCFTFAVPSFEHSGYEFPGGTQVTLNGSTVFYVASKTADAISMKITCYDRMTNTEEEFPCTDNDFIDYIHDNREKPMLTSIVLGRICTACGFSGYSMIGADTLLEAVPEIWKAQLMGRTCHDILIMLSQAFCGYWCCSGLANTLLFVPFGSVPQSTASASAEYHEILNNTSSMVITNFYLTGNGEEYGTPGDSGTIHIDTPLACPELYAVLSSRAVYCTGVNCANAYIDSLPDIPMKASFAAGGSEYITYCTAKISSKGILASLGRNLADEGNYIYKKRTRRELDKRYAEGDIWNNVQITKKDGLAIVYYNANGEEDD